MFDLTALMQDPGYIQSQLLFQNKDPSQAIALSQAAKERSQQLQQNQVSIQNQAAGQGALQDADLSKGLNPDVIGAVMKADPELGVKLQTIYTQQLQANPIGNMGANGTPMLTGEDYLKTLNPNYANTVKLASQGKVPLNAAMLKTPQGQQLYNAITNYEPGFDISVYNARVAARKDMMSGPTSNNIKSIETALNTLSQAKDASDELGGVNNASILNAPINMTKTAINEMENLPALKTYNNLSQNAADETTTAITKSGGTGHDRASRAEQFKAGQSPDARTASLQAAAQELLSRLDPVNDQYSRVMGTNTDKMDLLSPSAKKAYNKLMGIKDATQATANSITSDSLPPGFTADQIAEYKRINGIK